MQTHVGARARQIVGLLDLTSLNDDDSPAAVVDLCRRAQTPHGNVAAVCVWPRFAAIARQRLAGTGIRVAAVVNFPGGGDNADLAARETHAAIAQGAEEIDAVFPYHAWLWGNRAAGATLVAACRSACADRVTLKVILETGQLGRTREIAAAARCALQAGADFIKTSTGKTAVSASLEAAEPMLHAIRQHGRGGFKAAGGIRDLPTAVGYLELAEAILGRDWIAARTFRFGASGLLQALLNALGEAQPLDAEGY